MSVDEVLAHACCRHALVIPCVRADEACMYCKLLLRTHTKSKMSHLPVCRVAMEMHCRESRVSHSKSALTETVGRVIAAFMCSPFYLFTEEQTDALIKLPRNVVNLMYLVVVI